MDTGASVGLEVRVCMCTSCEVAGVGWLRHWGSPVGLLCMCMRSKCVWAGIQVRGLGRGQADAAGAVVQGLSCCHGLQVAQARVGVVGGSVAGLQYMGCRRSKLCREDNLTEGTLATHKVPFDVDVATGTTDTWHVHIESLRGPLAFGKFWSDKGQYGWVRNILV